MDAGMKSGSLRVKFIALWCVLLLVKVVLAIWLPPFGDEAFYWQEGRHLAWAYSDLPGCTAWLIRLGVTLGGDHPLAMRAPFLLLGATLPWLLRRIAARWFGAEAGWQAGLLAMLMPLSGLMGVLALPDVPLLFAALLCLDACAALIAGIEIAALLELLLALVLGAFTHYRFALVIVAGLAGLCSISEGRALLRQPRFWAVLIVGAAAWLPLLLWNIDHSGAGVQFQLVQRNPWRFHADGAWWLLEQFVAVTPLVFVLLLATFRRAWRDWQATKGARSGLVFAVAAVSVWGYFALAFFADQERVSFHWPLAGWLVLACAAPPLLANWSPRWRRALHASAGLMLLGASSFLLMAAIPALRADLAFSRWYPETFAGWPDIAAAVQAERAAMPAGTRVVVDNFLLGAELGFALGEPDIAVLDHPLNHKHGRAAQLQLWRLQSAGRSDWGRVPVLLVIEDSARPMKQRLLAYHALCQTAGNLPPPRVLNVDHGRKRFLLFMLDGASDGACIAPALGWIDTPAIDADVVGKLEVSGWAFKDGAGVAAVDLTLDGRMIAVADYGSAEPKVAGFWRISSDPQQPNVGFNKTVDLTGVPAGRHWLGLVIHGRDGSSEAWPEQPVRVETH